MTQRELEIQGKQVKILIDKGYNITKIAEELNINSSKVYWLCHKYYIQIPRHKKKKINYAEIDILRQQGYKGYAIAKKLGISLSNVYTIAWRGENRGLGEWVSDEDIIELKKEYSVKEISKMYHMTDNAIWQRLKKAKQNLNIK